MSAGSSIDSHVYVGESLYGGGVDADELIARIEAAGVHRAIAVPARPPGYHLGPANDVAAAAQCAYPDQLRCFARVDPNQGDAAVAELERALDTLGLGGLFLHPNEELFRINGPLVRPLMAVARERGISRTPVREALLIRAGWPSARGRRLPTWPASSPRCRS